MNDNPADDTAERPMGWAALQAQMPHAKERLDEGNPLALYDAVTLCRNGRLPMPDWLAQALLDLIRSAYMGEVKGVKGKGKSYIGEAKKNLRTLYRGQAVWQIRRVQEDRSEWVMLPAPVRKCLLARRYGDATKFMGFGRTEVDAFAVASKALAGTFARGEPRTMEMAYRELTKGEYPLPLTVALAETLTAFELAAPDEWTSFTIPDWVKGWEQTGQI